MGLTTSQQEVFNKITTFVTNTVKVTAGPPLMKMISLSGPAGTGKSYLTSELISTLDEKFKSRGLSLFVFTANSLDRGMEIKPCEALLNEKAQMFLVKTNQHKLKVISLLIL